VGKTEVVYVTVLGDVACQKLSKLASSVLRSGVDKGDPRAQHTNSQSSRQDKRKFKLHALNLIS